MIDREYLERDGFEGFIAIQRLCDTQCSEAPARAGVYVVLFPRGTEPRFLAKSVGGWFKQKDPTVSINELRANWVDDAEVIYIGETASLRRRLRQLVDFGQGEPVGHWGGRMLWQLEGASASVVAWKVVEDGIDPKQAKSHLMAEFKKIHVKRPFANLSG